MFSVVDKLLLENTAVCFSLQRVRLFLFQQWTHNSTGVIKLSLVLFGAQEHRNLSAFTRLLQTLKEYCSFLASLQKYWTQNRKIFFPNTEQLFLHLSSVIKTGKYYMKAHLLFTLFTIMCFIFFYYLYPYFLIVSIVSITL